MAEGFANPVTNASGELVRIVLQSVNYVTGVSGWAIFKDGNAEFNGVVIRGQLSVEDVDGSYIRIFDNNPGTGATILVQAATLGGHTVDPGFIYAESDPLFGFPYLLLSSPSMDGGDRSSIQVRSADPAGTGQGSSVDINATQAVAITAPRLTMNGFGIALFDVGYGMLNGAGAVSAGAEVAISTAQWTAASGVEPGATFENNYVYKVSVQMQAFASASFGIGAVRLRRGAGTIVGTLLHEWTIQRDNNLASTTFEVTGYIKNVSGANVTTKLSISLAKVAGVAANMSLANAGTVLIENVGHVLDNTSRAAIATAL
jgi:hypothetical protein